MPSSSAWAQGVAQPQRGEGIVAFFGGPFNTGGAERSPWDNALRNHGGAGLRSLTIPAEDG